MQFRFLLAIAGGLSLLQYLKWDNFEKINTALHDKGSTITFKIIQADIEKFRIDICFIETYDDLFNGSEELVIHSLSKDNIDSIFKYNHHDWKHGIFRINIFSNTSFNSSRGAMIHSGNRSNYFFIIPSDEENLEVTINLEENQRLNFNNCNIENLELLKVHSMLAPFREKMDTVLSELKNCNNNKCKDSIKMLSFPILQQQFTNRVNDILNVSFECLKVKAFNQHLILSEFYLISNKDIIQNAIIDDLDYLGINSKLKFKLNNSNQEEVKLTVSQKNCLTELIGYNIDTVNFPVFIDIWASWCGPCRTDNRTVLQELFLNHGQIIDMISISVDIDYEKWKQAESMDSIKWKSLRVEGIQKNEFINEFNIKSYPTKFIIYDQEFIKYFDSADNVIHELARYNLINDTK